MKIKRYLGVSLDPEIYEEVESRRGMIKRSTFVNEVLKKALLEPNNLLSAHLHHAAYHF